MALDTLEKRRNVPGVGRPWRRIQHHPVATPDSQWRAAVGLAYGGNGITLVVTTRRGKPLLRNVGKFLSR